MQLDHQITQDGYRNDRGASLVEYALLVCLVALIAVTGVASVGRIIGDPDSGAFEKTRYQLTSGAGSVHGSSGGASSGGATSSCGVFGCGG